MPRDSRPGVLIHVARVVAAILISIAVLIVIVTLDRTVLSRQPLLFLTAPIAIGTGYIPLWRWYPRQAYPIGLVFCPAMFFLLRYVHEWLL
jgi:hypothetical protein